MEPDALATLADRLAEAQPLLTWLHHDPTLEGLAGALEVAMESKESSPNLDAALDTMATTAERVALGQAAQLSWLDLISGEPPRPEVRRKFIVLQPVLDHDTLEPAGRVLDLVRKVADDLGLEPAKGITLRIIGEPAMMHDELKSLRHGMGLVALLSLGMVIALLVLGLRSWRLILATVAALLMGLVWTGFFAIAALGELNLLSVAFAVLFIGLSVDFGIHFALRTREAVDQGLATVAALSEAAASVGGALALSAAAAAIGFFSFLPHRLPRRFGIGIDLGDRHVHRAPGQPDRAAGCVDPAAPESERARSRHGPRLPSAGLHRTAPSLRCRRRPDPGPGIPRGRNPSLVRRRSAQPA